MLDKLADILIWITTLSPGAVVILVIMYLDLRQKHNRAVNDYEFKISLLRERIKNDAERHRKDLDDQRDRFIERRDQWAEEKQQMQKKHSDIVQQMHESHCRQIDDRVEERVAEILAQKGFTIKRLKVSTPTYEVDEEV